ncbi:MAG: site-2 protease family protein, partial [Acetobacter sp.]|nr:site-2 protease family protein [Acetobacter sp.]
MRVLNKRLRRLPIHPSFILLFLWFVCTGNFQAFFIFVSVVLTHELGHYMVAKHLGYKLDAFFLAPYGVSLNYKEKAFNSSDEIKIALAGPAVNLTLAMLAIGVWWLFPVTYNYTQVFVEQSVMLALFNLIPAYPLDGGRLFVATVSERFSRKLAVKIISIANIVFTFIFIVLFIVSCAVNFNPIFALAAVFMLSGLMQTKYEARYEMVNLYKKQVKDFSHPLSLVVGSHATLASLVKHIQINKFTLFYIVGEGRTRIVDEGT